MSEPTPPSQRPVLPPEAVTPEPPSEPFHPEAVGRKPSPGCGKPVAIGCGLALLLLLAAMLFLTFKAHDLLAWSIHAMEEGVVERLADDVSESQRERLGAAVDAAAARARSKDLDPAALQALQRQFMETARQQTIRGEELEEFISALEAFADSSAAEGGEGGG